MGKGISYAIFQEIGTQRLHSYEGVGWIVGPGLSGFKLPLTWLGSHALLVRRARLSSGGTAIIRKHEERKAPILEPHTSWQL